MKQLFLTLTMFLTFSLSLQGVVAEVEGATVDISVPEGFDRECLLVTGGDTEDDIIGIAFLVFVDDTDFFMVMASGANSEAASTRVIQLGEYIRDAEVQTEEVTFAENGSTGGVFDLMPGIDNELVEGLIITDEADSLLGMGMG